MDILFIIKEKIEILSVKIRVPSPGFEPGISR
jgi:hypothetical protein